MKISVLTESRADYGIYYPLLQALAHDDRFDMNLIVTGMHLSEKHGYTANEIVEFPFKINAHIDSDWLIVLGDRRPMLDAAISAAYHRIPVAHIQGGDRSGTIDESTRHAITRFANVHFPCTPESARRLIRMGEESWRIHIVGPLGIYAMSDQLEGRDAICREFALDPNRPIILVIQHPVLTQSESAGMQMLSTLKACEEYQMIIIYPNNDLGSDDMIRVIADSGILAYNSLPYLKFLSLLKACDVVVGNSSTGLYEAPLFGVPSVNIGTRQANREHGNSVEHVGYKTEEIRNAVFYQLVHGNRVLVNPFRYDVAGVQVILDTLLNTPIDENLLQKRLTY